MSVLRSPAGFGKEVGVILAIAVFLCIIYNTFAGRGLPLVRTAPVKVAAPDSLLFSGGRPFDSARVRELMEQQNTGGVSNPQPTPLQQQAMARPDSVAAVAVKEAAELFRTINIHQVRKLHAARRAMFLDGRPPEEFTRGHIRGAIDIPGENPGDRFPLLAPLPRDTMIVVYCSNPECNLGRMLIQFLKVMEFTNLYLYDEGWDGWVSAGLDTDTLLSARGKE